MSPLSSFRLLPTLFLALTLSAQAATEATIDLSGQVIQNGQTINLTSDANLDASDHYQYAITGTCHGTGNLAAFIPTGTPISQAMQSLGAGDFASKLTGKLSNPGATLPFTVLDQSIDGNVSFGNFSASAFANVLAEIGQTGAVTLGVSDVSITVNGSPDESSLVFEDGAQCKVEIETLAKYRPDCSLEPLGEAPVGDDVYNDNAGQTFKMNLKRGVKTDLSFKIGNDGTSDDDVFIKAAPTRPGFRVKYLLGTYNVTSQITTTGIILGSLDAGFGGHIIAKLTVLPGAALGAKQNVRLTIKSQNKKTLTDQATYAIKVIKN